MRGPDRDIRSLLDLLAREREILVAGRLDRLQEIGDAKAATLARLARRAHRPDAAALRRIDALARSNQRLYGAALSGIRKVCDQVAAMVSGGGAELRTYSPDGGLTPLAAGPGRVEHKA